MKKYTIGIDPGTKTGIAIIGPGNAMELREEMIHNAWFIVNNYVNGGRDKEVSVKIFVEDARQRKYFGDNVKEKQQGAGSIKRDCKIWEDFLKDIDSDFKMIHPIKHGTKLDHRYFCQITGWPQKVRTNEHKRDAGMIAFLNSGFQKIKAINT